ncbi:hypothetical protein NHX12_002391 [Muraenolepis orangiensis]|uniref:Uncharacterized protein n=1 Tax=Muraenolepis orangiensis TaxID=630683 RepID=A0A9Q0E0S2_9TELE|nr:hypothetical protein NHX12_002391 [Muraenolepis orangiensis]
MGESVLTHMSSLGCHGDKKRDGGIECQSVTAQGERDDIIPPEAMIHSASRGAMPISALWDRVGPLFSQVVMENSSGST